MAVFRLFRAYHAVLAVLSILVYLTGEAGLIHAWLGYAVAAVIAFRLAWSVVGPRHLGISRIFPDLEALRGIRWIDHPAVGKVLLSGIAINLLLATATGLALDHRPRQGDAALMGTRARRWRRTPRRAGTRARRRCPGGDSRGHGRAVVSLRHRPCGLRAAVSTPLGALHVVLGAAAGGPAPNAPRS
ncbi:MAG: hypothetical protein FJX51_08410, partial [Alphaproteobacteria bacterium]|nr:hypothetical protein [Alphaproteobacteria bacterium]